LTEKKHRKKLSREILGLLVITAAIALFLMEFLCMFSLAIVDSYLSVQEIVLTQAEISQLNDWAFHLSLLVSVGFFIVLFLFLLGERLSYIRDILAGIEALRSGRQDHVVPLEGSNELTQLADAVNYLSATQRQVREQEQALNEEKEQLIRTLSHDIRTPLTSILSYSAFLSSREDCTCEERTEYLTLIQKKAEQIKELTEVLLDGGRRSPEHFEDARLLMAQLAGEVEEALEDEFCLQVDLTACLPFSGTFDVWELRRIFDNMTSNIQKYADSAYPITLCIHTEDSSLVIRQENHIRTDNQRSESHHIGLNSIRRIAHNYKGRVDVQQDDGIFRIRITLSDI